MQQQDRDRVAYYASLAIFFSFIELFIPKILPFFRLGIANIPILLSLDLPLSSFSLLLLLKGIGNSYISGNLFSVFALVSIAQTFASGFLMYALKRVLRNHISNYGLSLSGALVSTYVQIYLASLYIGKAISELLGIMLSLSLISSLLVAYFSYRIELPKVAPSLEWNERERNSKLQIATLLISGMAVMMIKSPVLSLLAFALALLEQKMLGRKIKIVPHLIIFITMVATSLLTPSGKILLSLGSFPITLGSLENGIEKAFILSASISLSQGYSTLINPGKGIVGKTLGYYTALVSSFRENENLPILKRISHCLSLDSLKARKKIAKSVSVGILCLFTLCYVAILVVSRIYPSPLF